jgi:hypothetical protein
MNSPNLPQPSADRRAYETRDVAMKPIIWLALAVLLLAGSSQVGLWLLLRHYRSTATQQDPQLSPLTNIEQIPPRPRLQSAPMLDYAEFIAAQNQQLDSYGWVDKEKGVVRIPVARAMELALERGLPKPDKTDGTDGTDATEKAEKK